METIISILGLSIGYTSEVIVENINFELKKGEFGAIVGTNGIGKSTLLRTLSRLQPHLKGEIILEGKPLFSLSPSHLAKKLALVLTDTLATKNLSVHELIALARQPYTNWLGTLGKHDKSIILETLQVFDLMRIKNKKCFELSDGQLQRVLIARATAQETPLIFLDEPTTHLDLANKVRIFKLLQRLAHEQGKTVLFTTHEIEMAIQLCDKILILEGMTNPFGTPEQLIKQGGFSKLFPSALVEFDSKTKSFKIK